MEKARDFRCWQDQYLKCGESHLRAHHGQKNTGVGNEGSERHGLWQVGQRRIALKGLPGYLSPFILPGLATSPRIHPTPEVCMEKMLEAWSLVLCQSLNELQPRSLVPLEIGGKKRREPQRQVWWPCQIWQHSLGKLYLNEPLATGLQICTGI